MLDQVQQDINNAMKASDRKTAGALRMLFSSLKNAYIDNQGSLTDEQARDVIKKEIKKRVEARDLYAKNDRSEQASQEEFERTLFARYVPSQLNEEQIDELITTSAEELSELNFAKLMPLVMKATQGNADGKLVSERVKDYINRSNATK
jgi:hypothetical protein